MSVSECLGELSVPVGCNGLSICVCIYAITVFAQDKIKLRFFAASAVSTSDASFRSGKIN